MGAPTTSTQPGITPGGLTGGPTRVAPGIQSSALKKVSKSKSKTRPTLGSFLFSTPEQKLFRFLISEPTTSFTPRVLSSKLKGVRGLGGADGIMEVLHQLEEMGLVHFQDNNRAIMANNDSLIVNIMKRVSAICDLANLKGMLEPLSSKGVLYGSRATGDTRSGSDYDLFVATRSEEEVRRVVSGHPLAKKIELCVWDEDDYLEIEQKDSQLARQLDQGIVLWGSSW